MNWSSLRSLSSLRKQRKLLGSLFQQIKNLSPHTRWQFSFGFHRVKHQEAEASAKWHVVHRIHHRVLQLLRLGICWVSVGWCIRTWSCQPTNHICWTKPSRDFLWTHVLPSVIIGHSNVSSSLNCPRISINYKQTGWSITVGEHDHSSQWFLDRLH